MEDATILSHSFNSKPLNTPQRKDLAIQTCTDSISGTKWCCWSYLQTNLAACPHYQLRLRLTCGDIHSSLKLLVPTGLEINLGSAACKFWENY